MLKYCCSIGIVVVGVLYSGFHGWYWLAHKIGLVRAAEYSWVKQALKPHVSSCPIHSEFEERRHSVCPALHPYYDPEFQSNLDAVSQSVLTSENRLKLLSNSESYHEKIRLINQAKRSVHIASLQFVCSSSIDPGFVASSPHQSAQNFVITLIAARQRGVDVRLFLDGEQTWRLREGNCIKQY